LIGRIGLVAAIVTVVALFARWLIARIMFGGWIVSDVGT